MKKVIEMVVCCMLIVTLVGCKNAVTTNVKIDYGTSAIYTKEDMDSAIDTIKETFKSFEGCELYNLSSSDEYERLYSSHPSNRLRDVSCIIFHIHPMMFVGMKKILHG